MHATDFSRQFRANDHEQTFALVLLAGSLNPYALRNAVGLPALCLPVTASHTLLDLWLDAAADAPGCCGVRIVTSSRTDAGAIHRQLTQRQAEPAEERTVSETYHGGRPDSNGYRNGSAAGIVDSDDDLPIEVMVDPSNWRGPAGLLRDIAEGEAFSNASFVIAAEAACLPPATLEPFVREFSASDDGLVLGATSSDGRYCDHTNSAAVEPAGVYALSQRAIEMIPPIGYYDLREQLLPEMYKRGMAARLAATFGESIRLHSREQYFAACKRMMQRANVAQSIASDARRSETASFSGPCLVRRGATIEAGAVVHESIILDGASIGRDAVVSRCIIGAGATVGRQEVVRNEIRTASETTRTPGSDHGRNGTPRTGHAGAPGATGSTPSMLSRFGRLKSDRTRGAT